ncbi:hypothetical protein [Micromonospora sp. IBHARD004]|uniref:hypothetical protein n=1 Tax=Micromonospora sp. IBHARD004 TaxID=3457764 RepID=UPI004059A858
MLLRLAYLGVTNAFALLRLLSMSDRDKYVEVLALRHQITVLERQLGKTRPRLFPQRTTVHGRPAAPPDGGRGKRVRLGGDGLGE